MNDVGSTRRRVTRRRRDADAPPLSEADEVAIEEPLEIRVADEALAVTMRTPGDDRALAAGFLYAEGVISSRTDVGSIAHCGEPGEEGFGNVLNVTPGPGVLLDVARITASRRGTLTTAACGVCGRRSVEDLLARCEPLATGPTLTTALLLDGVGRLQQAQRLFTRTGATHAAAAFDAEGGLLTCAEDVGRHNAVDKVFGRLLLGGELAPAPALLVVSGRTSFEIVQKAAVARVGCVVGVSGTTSLAADLAERLGITLAGFARGDELALYAHRSRVAD